MAGSPPSFESLLPPSKIKKPKAIENGQDEWNQVPKSSNLEEPLCLLPPCGSFELPRNGQDEWNQVPKTQGLDDWNQVPEVSTKRSDYLEDFDTTAASSVPRTFSNSNDGFRLA